jgi:hypothetical protein
LLLSARTAQAQNTDSFFFGDDAALTAGAVTANTRDASSVWYSPAGLASIEHASINVSGSTFRVRLRATRRALGVDLDGEQHYLDIKSTDILSIPNSVGVTFRDSPSLVLGLGLFTIERDLRRADPRLDVPIATQTAGTVRVRENLDLKTDHARYAPRCPGPEARAHLASGHRARSAQGGL